LNGKKVLLVEAGGDHGNSINYQVPVFHAISTEDPEMKWDYYVDHYGNPTEAAKDSKLTWTTPSGKDYTGKSPPKGSKPKGVLYPRTGTLGGCTAHNAMVAIYPHDSDWSHIQDLTGDQTWNPGNLRRLWERLERSEYAKPGAKGHGFNGTLATSTPPPNAAAGDPRLAAVAGAIIKTISKSQAEAKANMGFIQGGDLNSADVGRDAATGAWLIPLSVSHDGPKKIGKRSGSREIVLNVVNAKNEDGSKKYHLDLALNTFVTKVVFRPGKDGKPKAVGVEAHRGQSLYKADPRARNRNYTPRLILKATKEVIISAGAFNSPQLLKLSGIGPRQELAKFGIPVISNLPGVGTNLQDHFEIGVTHAAKTPFVSVKDCTFGQGIDPCLEAWKEGKGSYGITNGFTYGVVQRSSIATQDPVYGKEPDLIMFGGLANFRGYYPGYSKDSYLKNVWTWVILKAHTANRAGTVKLRSADPFEPPAINFNYFDAQDRAGPRDLIAMAEAIDIARKITMNVNVTGDDIGFKEVLPGAEKTFPSKALDDHIKAESWGHHASCTVPIGAASDPNAVLDSKFRVRGVEGLRVVDASAFPRIPGTFVAVPTYMLGEKAADSILFDQ
jgi:choline dehydrogenase